MRPFAFSLLIWLIKGCFVSVPTKFVQNNLDKKFWDGTNRVILSVFVKA